MNLNLLDLGKFLLFLKEIRINRSFTQTVTLLVIWLHSCCNESSTSTLIHHLFLLGFILVLSIFILKQNCANIDIDTSLLLKKSTV